MPDHPPSGRGLVGLELSVVVVPAGAPGVPAAVVVVDDVVFLTALTVARGIEAVRRGGRQGQLAPRVRGRGESVQIPVVKV